MVALLRYRPKAKIGHANNICPRLIMYLLFSTDLGRNINRYERKMLQLFIYFISHICDNATFKPTQQTTQETMNIFELP